MDKLTEACGDGSDARSANPVLKMVDMFMRDPGAHADSWSSGESQRAAVLARQGRGPMQNAPDMAMRQFLNPEEFERFSGDGLADAFRRMDMGRDEFADVGPYMRGAPQRYDMMQRGPQWMPPPVSRPPEHLIKDRDSRLAFYEQERMRHGPGASSSSREMHRDFVSEFEGAFDEAAGKDDMAEFEEIYTKRPQLQHRGPPPRDLWAQEFERHQEEFGEYEDVYSKLRNGIVPAQASSSSSWANEYEKQEAPEMVREFEDFEADDQDVKPPDFDSMRQWLNQFETMDEAELEKEYEKAWRESANEDASAFSQERKDKLNRPYEFQPNNPFLQDPDAFQKGIDEFNRGSMRKAVLLLEAAVQQDSTNARAWEYLGQAQAENDRDDLASLALLRAVQADPSNRSALMTLAVSYTNDFHKDRALDCLHQWIASHPDYAAIADEPDAILTNDEDANQRIVTDMFIRAARMRVADPDPDVQTALGLLFNLSFEYDRAVDCFKAAVVKRPDDYLLWNKLGATQANGRRSEEAVDAYFRALEIKPVYTRARANLGISFLALNRYGDAAKAFLSALAINNDAEHIWGNLRTVFSLMQRPDLVDKCDSRDVRAFSDEFNFG
eukprot:TRINITY_DN258_c0_g1_i2.p1 TRINITY_DN258_c0_g1~~TRINITY_DN258_c0_g1_i2.p1  ORF type:complete len:612 (-),score=134.44 TRINITY_DN258_c0_g1_i2:115-1950(-)